MKNSFIILIFIKSTVQQYLLEKLTDKRSTTTSKGGQHKDVNYTELGHVYCEAKDRSIWWTFSDNLSKEDDIW